MSGWTLECPGGIPAVWATSLSMGRKVGDVHLLGNHESKLRRGPGAHSHSTGKHEYLEGSRLETVGEARGKKQVNVETCDTETRTLHLPSSSCTNTLVLVSSVATQKGANAIWTDLHA